MCGADKPMLKKCQENGFLTMREVMDMAQAHCSSVVGQQDDHHTQESEITNGFSLRLFEWKNTHTTGFFLGFMAGVVFVCIALYGLRCARRAGKVKAATTAAMLASVAGTAQQPAARATSFAHPAPITFSHNNTEAEVAEAQMALAREMGNLRRSLRRQRVQDGHRRDAHRFQELPHPVAEGYVA